MADDQLNQSIEMALHTPHNIMIADTVLDIKITGFNSTITLGYINPANVMQPAVTLLMPTDKLYDMATQIRNQLKSQSRALTEQHTNFIEKLDS